MLRHPVPGEEPIAHFERAAQSQRLVVTRRTVLLSDLGAQALPFVTFDGEVPIVVLDRRGASLKIQRGPDAEEWVDPRALGKESLVVLHCAPATPAEAFASHDHHLSPWQRLWAWARLERDDLFVVVIYAAVAGVLSLATPIAVQSLVGTVAFGTLLQPIVVLALLFFFALAFQATLKALKTWVIEALQARLFARVSLDLAYRLPRARSAETTPELMNRFFDVVTAQKTLAHLLTDGLSSVMQITVGCLVLAFYHPALLALDLVLLLGTLAFVFLPFRRGVDSALTESSAKYELAAWLEELVRVPSVFRSSRGATLALTRAEALTRRYLSARRTHFTVVFSQTVSALVVQVLTSAVLLGFGGYLVVRGSLTLGQLIAAEFIVATVTARITNFGKLLESAYDLLVGFTKVGHLLDLELEKPSTDAAPATGPATLTLTGVEGANGPLDLTVTAGSKTVLQGTRGSLLAPWLTGARELEAGRIEVDGVDVRQLEPLTLRDSIAIVDLTPAFAGTVADNLGFDRASQEGRAVIEQLGLAPVLRSLPDGFQTELDARGAPLTVTQQLQLSIARAIAQRPRLIVVEDVLELLDEKERRLAVQALTNPSAPWTLVVLGGDGHSMLSRACRTPAPRMEAAS